MLHRNPPNEEIWSELQTVCSVWVSCFRVRWWTQSCTYSQIGLNCRQTVQVLKNQLVCFLYFFRIRPWSNVCMAKLVQILFSSCFLWDTFCSTALFNYIICLSLLSSFCCQMSKVKSCSERIYVVCLGFCCSKELYFTPNRKAWICYATQGESGADVFGFTPQECSIFLPVQWSSRRCVWSIRIDQHRWQRGPVKTAL